MQDIFKGLFQNKQAEKSDYDSMTTSHDNTIVPWLTPSGTGGAATVGLGGAATVGLFGADRFLDIRFTW